MLGVSTPEVTLDDLTPEVFNFVQSLADGGSPLLDDACTEDEAYDVRVQKVLDEHWPGTTGKSCIRRTGDTKAIYEAHYNDARVIVKSVYYSQEAFESNVQYKTFLNYMNEEVPVAAYIEPSVVESDDDLRPLLVTMSIYAEGYAPMELPPDEPWTWIYDETAVRTIGKWCGDYRRRAI